MKSKKNKLWIKHKLSLDNEAKKEIMEDALIQEEEVLHQPTDPDQCETQTGGFPSRINFF